MLENLKKYHIVLGSNSPRRRELLAGLGFPFEVSVLPGVSEDYPASLPLREIAAYIAREKAGAYRARLDEETLLITADTVVICGDEVLGKPRDAADAFRMLKEMSGKKNTVYSSCCVWHKAADTLQLFYDSTDVYFKPYTDDDIRAYIATGAPMDKAGGYGIQEGFDIYVERIDGEEDTVIGFPMTRLLQL